ncbi:MAG: L-threonine 3-dehydrogenase [Nitrospiria bacterium]
MLEIYVERVPVMKALAKVEKGTCFQMIERPRPVPKPDEALVRVDVVSICGTDLHLDQWDAWAEKRLIHLPRIIGHEFSGKVVALGAEATRFQVGDCVSSDSHIPCLNCGICRKGAPHLCDRLKILGIDRDGCFAEYAAIPARSLWKNDPALKPEIASVQDPLGNAVYATLVEPVIAKTVAILGDGPIGLFAAGVARASRAAKIMLSGLNPFTLDIAKKMGADVLINAGEADVAQRIRSETGGIGADVVLEMSGNPRAIRAGFEAIRKGGRFTAFGLTPAPVTLDWNNQVIFKGIRVYGISGRKMFETWRQMADLLRSGNLDPRPVITHVLDFEDFARGFQMMEATPRQAAKVVLVVNPELRHLIPAP